MRLKILSVLGLCCAATFLMSVRGEPQATPEAWVEQEITVDGPALFYLVDRDIRRELWSVDCRLPLRGCVARAPGLVLRADENQNLWLMAAAGPEDRVSVLSRNYMRPVQGLFSAPLGGEQIAALSAKSSYIVLENDGEVLLQTRTAGLDRVGSYLLWIQSHTARTLRDARLWPGDEALSTEKMTPDVLERYEIMQRRIREKQRQMVPNYKPQVAFAMYAQRSPST